MNTNTIIMKYKVKKDHPIWAIALNGMTFELIDGYLVSPSGLIKFDFAKYNDVFDPIEKAGQFTRSDMIALIEFAEKTEYSSAKDLLNKYMRSKN